MEELTAAARPQDAGQNDGTVTPELLQATVNDFIPPTYPTEVELQQLAAVLECTSRDLLPERFRQMDRAEVVERLTTLKRQVDSWGV